MIKRGLLFFILWLAVAGVKADEGMWLPNLLSKLNYEDMQAHGLKLSAEEIYSINQSSLKDAIVSMGRGFCTGEIISQNGLLLTNHHCGYSYIQRHSTLENDYLTNGFWAASYEEEIPNEGLYIRFLIRIEDVTEDILVGVSDDMDEDLRDARIRKNISKIEWEAQGGTHYSVNVRSFYEGNEYYLFVYEIYNDVRLVGAPPESIGKFGGDTDNWMWPRHTGDFSLFRVYMSPDGKPAEYSPDNIPLKPRHYLPVSLDGVQEGDFAMIFGYPGSTNRYLTSFGVKLALDETNPTRVKIREKRLALIKEDMMSDSEIRLKYASKYAKVSNYYKYYIGQSLGLENLKVYDKKLAIEGEFNGWLNEDPVRKETYKNPLSEIQKAYEGIREFNKTYLYFVEAGMGVEIVPFSNNLRRLEKLLSAGERDESAIQEEAEWIKDRADDFFKDYNMPTDKKVFTALMEMFYQEVPEEYHPDIFIEAKTNKFDSEENVIEFVKPGYDGDFTPLGHYIYSSSILTDETRFMVFLANPDYEVLSNDPGYRFAKSIISAYRKVSVKRSQSYDQLSKGRRLFIKGLREMNPDKIYYPDANSTMRVTYGNVLSYEPRDAVLYEYYTTLNGVMEKEDPDKFEFIVPEKLKELYKNKEYGQYANRDGEMVVGFLSNNDITGGNSGSPVINSRGELIGTAFDGNWEAMSGGIAFEPDLQRCINVDIRYTLFIIDKFAGATHLVDEMTLIKKDIHKSPKPKGSRKKRKKNKSTVTP